MRGCDTTTQDRYITNTAKVTRDVNKSLRPKSLSLYFCQRWRQSIHMPLVSLKTLYHRFCTWNTFPGLMSVQSSCLVFSPWCFYAMVLSCFFLTSKWNTLCISWWRSSWKGFQMNMKLSPSCSSSFRLYSLNSVCIQETFLSSLCPSDLSSFCYPKYSSKRMTHFLKSIFKSHRFDDKRKLLRKIKLFIPQDICYAFCAKKAYRASIACMLIVWWILCCKEFKAHQ